MSSRIDSDGSKSVGPKHWILYSVLNLIISLRIQLVDARFTYRRGIKASRAGRLLLVPAIAFERVSRNLQTTNQDILFRRFYGLHGLHYGPTGRGYHGTSSDSHDDRMSRYRGQVSRLSAFVGEFSDILGYEDGDTFVDLGCGAGQNIRFLSEAYPSSLIIGTDMNRDAVALIVECEPSVNVQLSVGDMREEEFLSQTLSQPTDHIVLSHVFSLIFARSARQTCALRQRFINHVVDHARKSVIILDSFGKQDELTISVEQKQRAYVTDDVMSYFGKHPNGRAIMVQFECSRAIIFSRKIDSREK